MSKVDNVFSSLTLKAKAKEVQPVVNQAQVDSYDASSIEDVQQLLSKSKSDTVASALAGKADAVVSDEHVADFFEEELVPGQAAANTEVVIRISVNGGKVSIVA